MLVVLSVKSVVSLALTLLTDGKELLPAVVYSLAPDVNISSGCRSTRTQKIEALILHILAANEVGL